MKSKKQIKAVSPNSKKNAIKGGKITKSKSSAKTKRQQKPPVSHKLDGSKLSHGVSELLRIVQERKEEKTELFDSEGDPVFLVVCAIKIANIPTRVVRIALPHGLLQETSDVALIVRDLEPRVRRPDNDAVVQLYESKLMAQGFKHPIKVLPLRQIMTEYNTYESKRQLCNQFDVFLADAHISGRLVPLLGKSFTQKRKNPIPVTVDEPVKMKLAIEKALSKTGLRLSSNGPSHTVQVGHTLQKPKQIAENIVAVAEELCKSFPGGWTNVRSLVVKTARSPGVPLYVSICDPNEVHLHSTRVRPKHSKVVQDELSTALHAQVKVWPSGKVEKIETGPKNMVSKKKQQKDSKVQAAGKRKHLEDFDDEGEEEVSDLSDDEEESRPTQQTTSKKGQTEAKTKKNNTNKKVNGQAKPAKKEKKHLVNQTNQMGKGEQESGNKVKKVKAEPAGKKGKKGKASKQMEESDSEELEAEQAEEAYLMQLSESAQHQQKNIEKEKTPKSEKPNKKNKKQKKSV